MGSGFRKRPGNKAVPYLSHEFIIQNHGDIATCLCMVFVVGLMFQTSAPLASLFIAPKHNITDLSEASAAQPTLYTYGYKDLCLLFFYTLVAVIFHAIIQEYILDKLSRKVRLSKTKANKFNESGQLLSFYVASALVALSIFRDEGYFQSLSFFWNGYPHTGLTFLTKFFFVFQMSYWLHTFPELYFQKVKKEDVPARVRFALLNLFIAAGIYYLNLTRIGLTLLFIEYVVNSLFHFSRLLYFSGKNKISRISFNIYNVLFVLARLTEIILAVFVFLFGLKNSSIESINFEEKNFNTQPVRFVCLGVILALQAWMLWNFILFQFKKIRENTKPSSVSRPTRQQPKRAKASRGDESESDDVRDVPSEGESPKQKVN